jgi:hypothetical protein
MIYLKRGISLRKVIVLCIIIVIVWFFIRTFFQFIGISFQGFWFLFFLTSSFAMIQRKNKVLLPFYHS